MKKFSPFRYVLLGALIPVMVLVLAACYGEKSADRRQQQIVNDQQQIYAINQPIPLFDYSFTRDLTIQLYMLENEAVNTFSYIFLDGVQRAIFGCPSIGYALDAGTSLTNPVAPFIESEPVAGSTSNIPNYLDGVTVAQAEPNGVYPDNQSMASYVFCVISNGDVVPVRSEAINVTSPLPFVWNEAQQMYLLDESNTAGVTTIDVSAAVGNGGGLAPVQPALEPTAIP